MPSLGDDIHEGIPHSRRGQYSLVKRISSTTRQGGGARNFRELQEAVGPTRTVQPDKAGFKHYSKGGGARNSRELQWGSVVLKGEMGRGTRTVQPGKADFQHYSTGWRRQKHWVRKLQRIEPPRPGLTRTVQPGKADFKHYSTGWRRQKLPGAPDNLSPKIARIQFRFQKLFREKLFSLQKTFLS